MRNEDHMISPEEAQAQLEREETLGLASGSDRRVHGAGVALFGLTVGLFFAVRNVTSGTGELITNVLFVAAVLAVGLWVERASRTTPRRATLVGRAGLIASLLLALAVVLPWLNFRAQDDVNTWPIVLVGALVVAAPSLIAAAVITRAKR